MADQTGAAVDTLLGLLSGAIRDEARLLGGIQGDMQFIKDEMDSMNGFLLHLIKTESEHDDQLRAWMKQVRDIAHIAQDCIVVYMHDIDPLQVPSTCSWAFLRNLPSIIWTCPSRHRLATKIQKLKVRVRDVGERRLRYDVSVRSTQPRKKPAAGQGDEEEDRREDFLDALLGPHRHGYDGNHGGIVDIDKAIRQLPPHLRSRTAAKMIHAIVKRCTRTAAKEMLLRALYAYPQGNDLENLKNKTDEAEDPDKAVMIFCYSKLSTDYKSCLQYLTAFQEEDRISRTSMVRRWLAEGLVVRDPARTLEKAAENCFRELIFLGFVSPLQTGAAGKVKSCKMDQEIKKFVEDISQSENFVRGNLPYHLEKQVAFREIARKQQQQPPPEADTDNKCMPITACGLCTTEKKKDPLVEMVDLLEKIQLNKFYRLNVLDLGGCKGLRKRHLKTICEVRWLKYLSLRDTDISVLPSKQINKLKLLQTLDVRQTNVLITSDIFLPNLKHLLAGRAYCATHTTDELLQQLTAVQMPSKIMAMRDMEILSHVQVKDDDDTLDLPELIRKLGVLLIGRQPETIRRLLRTVSKLSDSLRSLSIYWSSTKNQLGTLRMDMEDTEQCPKSLESLHINGFLGNNGLPTWCQSLNMLSKVTLCETKLPAVQSLKILGKLPVLCSLRLRRNSLFETIITFSAGDFCSLKFLLMEDDKIRWIEFQPTVAPKLERITWWCFANTTTDLTTLSETVLRGMNELPSLKFVEFNPGQRRLNVPTNRCGRTSGEDRRGWSRILWRM